MAATTNSSTTTYTQDLAADMSQVLASTSGGSTTDYLYGNEGEQLGSLNAGTRTWYGVDGQGSIRQVLTDSGNVTGTQDYDPFGSSEGATLGTTFGYAGQLQDPTTGAEYLRARWYQPGTGTLLGVDPRLEQTGQPYVYALDNPISWSDPTGLDCGLLQLLSGGCRLPTWQEAQATYQNEVRPETYSAAVAVAGFYDTVGNGTLSRVAGWVGVYVPQCSPDYEQGADFGLAYNLLQQLLSGGTDAEADANLAAGLPRLLSLMDDAGQDADRLTVLANRLAALEKLDGAAAYSDDFARLKEDLALLASMSPEERAAYLPDLENDLQTLETNMQNAARPQVPQTSSEAQNSSDTTASSASGINHDVLAEQFGYTKISERSHGQPVYRNGNRYISPDIDSHIGGVWKMADSVANLGSKATRMGTYDANLQRIGP